MELNHRQSLPSDYKYLDVNRRKNTAVKLLQFLALASILVGIIVAIQRTPVLSNFFAQYWHWFGEALWVVAIGAYLFLQRGYKQPRAKVVVSNDPILESAQQLVKDDSTYIYVDCAVLSSNVYQEDEGKNGALPYTAFLKNDSSSELQENVLNTEDKRILIDWELVERIGTVKDKGLLIEVHRHKQKHVYNQEVGECVTYAIVFRGTVGFSSWIANAHWFFKWLPIQDQYDQIKYIVPDIVNRIREQHPDGQPINIIATGHSLGGGLAQHACYISEEIKTAYVFNSSPVTGYTDFDKWQRKLHTEGVRIHRLFERGELLEGLRFFMKIVYLFDPGPNENPYLCEHRFDFEEAGLIDQHGMLPMALSLCYLRDHNDDTFAVQRAAEKEHRQVMSRAREMKKKLEAKQMEIQRKVEVEAF